jgi:hypothetical protein
LNVTQITLKNAARTGRAVSRNSWRAGRQDKTPARSPTE